MTRGAEQMFKMNRLFKRITIASIIAAVVLAFVKVVATNVLSSPAQDAAEAIRITWDSISCGGNEAMRKADALSDEAEKLATRDVRTTMELYSRSNSFYKKAYDCGFDEAGLVLASRYCTGLGHTRAVDQARRLLNEIEYRHSGKFGSRIKDVRSVCSF